MAVSTVYELHAEICKMFSNPKRLEIIDHLRNGEKTVSELVNLSGLQQSALSKHLNLMRQNGVLLRRKEGVNVFYSLSDPKIMEAFEIFRQILRGRLEENEKLAEELKEVASP